MNHRDKTHNKHNIINSDDSTADSSYNQPFLHNSYLKIPVRCAEDEFYVSGGKAGQQNISCGHHYVLVSSIRKKNPDFFLQARVSFASSFDTWSKTSQMFLKQ